MPQDQFKTSPRTLGELIAEDLAQLTGAPPPAPVDCSVAQLAPSLRAAIADLIAESLACFARCGAPGARSINLTQDRGRLRLVVRGPQGSSGALGESYPIVALADSLGGFARVDHTPFGGLEVAVYLRGSTTPDEAT